MKLKKITSVLLAMTVASSSLSVSASPLELSETQVATAASSAGRKNICVWNDEYPL